MEKNHSQIISSKLPEIEKKSIVQFSDGRGSQVSSELVPQGMVKTQPIQVVGGSVKIKSRVASKIPSAAISVERKQSSDLKNLKSESRSMISGEHSRAFTESPDQMFSDQVKMLKERKFDNQSHSEFDCCDSASKLRLKQVMSSVTSEKAPISVDDVTANQQIHINMEDWPIQTEEIALELVTSKVEEQPEKMPRKSLKSLIGDNRGRLKGIGQLLADKDKVAELKNKKVKSKKKLSPNRLKQSLKRHGSAAINSLPNRKFKSKSRDKYDLMGDSPDHEGEAEVKTPKKIIIEEEESPMASNSESSNSGDDGKKTVGTPNPSNRNLSNQFNDQQPKLLQAFKAGIGNLVKNRMKENLIQGSNQFRQEAKANAVIDLLKGKGQSSRHLQTILGKNIPNSPLITPEMSSGIVHDSFFENFTIENMQTFKCIIVRSLMINSKQLMVKKIPAANLELIDMMKQRQKRKEAAPSADEPVLNDELLPQDVKLADAWVNLPPRLGKQSFQQCYGLVKIQSDFYTISDIVQDNVMMPHQQAKLYGEEKQAEFNEYLMSHYGVGNAGQEQQKPLNLSKNMYDQIKSLKLGNLASLDSIPVNYIELLFNYTMQVAEAFEHAHAHDCIHGAFDMSKVLLQVRDKVDYSGITDQEGRLKAFASKMRNQRRMLLRHKSSMNTLASGLVNAVLHKDEYDETKETTLQNFILINFEPWRVEATIKKYEKEMGKFKDFMDNNNCFPDRAKYVQMLKVLDLQAFGNTIMEILVAKYSERQKDQSTRRSQADSTSRRGSQETIRDGSKDSNTSPTKTNESARSKRELGDDILSSKLFSEKPNPLSDVQDEEGKDKIQLDQIPLKWCAVPEFKKVLEILNLSFGPYGYNNKIHDLDVSKQFKMIAEVARQALQSMKRRISVTIQDNQPTDAQSQVSQDILMSSQLNNQAVLHYLNMQSQHPQRNMKLVKDTLKKALKLNPENTVALVNQKLLEWSSGRISDDELKEFLEDKLYRKDAEAAKLLYLIFKQVVNGQNPYKGEMERIVGQVYCDFDKVTNLAGELLTNQMFLKKENQNLFIACMERGEAALDDAASLTSSSFGMGLRQFSNQPIRNRTINLLNNEFVAQSFFFSNNDYYLGVIGKSEFVLIDARSGKETVRQKLPQVVPVEEPPELLDNNTRQTVLSDGSDSQPKLHGSGAKELKRSQTDGSQDSYSDVDVREGGSRSITEPEGGSNDKRDRGTRSDNTTSREETMPSKGLRLITQMQGQNSSSALLFQSQSLASKNTKTRSKANLVFDASKLVIPETQVSQRSLMSEDEEEAKQELIALRQNIKVDWIADIRNDGKMIALYDKSQPIINRLTKFKSNRQQIMYIYMIKSRKNRTICRKEFELDLDVLLENEEVMSFGFDDILETENQICIQGKDLKLYLVDFSLSKLVGIEQQPSNLINKSIFYQKNIQNKPELYSPIVAQVKEYLQDQEQICGNKVILPKINDELIVVQLKDSNHIQLVNIQNRKIVRQFTLSKHEFDFQEPVLEKSKNRKSIKAEKKSTMIEINKAFKILEKNFTQKVDAIKQELEKQKKQPKPKVPGFQATYLLKQDYISIEVEKLKKIKAKQEDEILQGNFDAVNMGEDESPNHSDNEEESHGVIKTIDISPLGQFLVAIIGQEIHLKILTYPNQKFGEQAAEQKSKIAPLCPVYFDNDYGPKEFMSSQKDEEDVLNISELPLMTGIEQHEQICSGQLKPEQISKIIPSAFDRNLSIYRNLMKIPVGQSIKVERLHELNSFVMLFQKRPDLMLSCKLKPKNRISKIAQTMQMIRSLPDLDQNQISINKFSGLKRFQTIDNMIFTRSFEYVDCVCPSNMSDRMITAVIKNRELELYNLVSGDMLATLNVPSAKSMLLNNLSYSTIGFLDNDQLIYIQDSERRLVIVPVQGLIEGFSSKTAKQQTNDVTIKIEKILGEDIDIVNEFGIAQASDEEPTGKARDADGDEPSASGKLKKFLNIDSPIKRIVQSPSTSQLSYLLIISEQRFMLYYIQEDQQNCCDAEKLIDCNYRFLKEIRQKGQITTAAFDQGGSHFLTISCMGWLSLWSIEQKEIVKSVRVDIGKSLEPCTDAIIIQRSDQVLLNLPKNNRIILVRIAGLHHILSGIQQTVETEGNEEDEFGKENVQQQKQKSLKRVKTQQLESSDITDLHKNLSQEDLLQRGQAIKVQVDRSLKYAFVVYKNNYVAVYNLINCSQIQLMGPFNAQQVLIDELCTYMTLLQQDQRKIDVNLLQWDYQVQNGNCKYYDSIDPDLVAKNLDIVYGRSQNKKPKRRTKVDELPAEFEENEEQQETKDENCMVF